MQTALDKFITIIRLVHEAAPDMPIMVRFKGERGNAGRIVDLTLEWSALAERDGISEFSMVPDMGAITHEGGPLDVRSCAAYVVDLLKIVQQPIHAQEHLAKVMQVKRHSPKFGMVPPDERLKQWREWAASLGMSEHATRMGLASDETSDVDLRLCVGERIETLKGLVEEYRKALGR